MRKAIIVTTILWASACTNATSARLDVVQIVRKEIAAISAADRLIRCTPSPNEVLIGFDCIQTFSPQDERHFAALSVQVKRAQGAANTDPSGLTSLGMGPGGGGASYKKRTRDGAYDIFANDLQSLTEGQQPRLPQAGELIDKILADYDREK